MTRDYVKSLVPHIPCNIYRVINLSALYMAKSGHSVAGCTQPPMTICISHQKPVNQTVNWARYFGVVNQNHYLLC